MSPHRAKELVRRYWDQVPIGTRHVTAAPYSDLFFAQSEARRFDLEPFIPHFARFHAWQNRQILEIGCGTGIDLLQFARAGARACAVDLSESSCRLARQRLSRAQAEADVLVADAETLPFKAESFDLVYSWGVLHHTPEIIAAIREVHRVLVPGGTALVMLYHMRSLFALKLWLRYGLLSGVPGRHLRDILASHLESPGTQAFTVGQAKRLFNQFSQVRISRRLTAYDIALGRNVNRRIPIGPRLGNWLGWFLLIQVLK